MSFWMQTTGAALLAAEPCRLPRVWLLAHDGRSARGLLYLAAVSADWHKQEDRQGTVDATTGLAHARRVEASAQWWRASFIKTRLKTQGRACIPILDIAASARF
jgi:hypothetical protein